MTKADVKPNFTNLEPMINILCIMYSFHVGKSVESCGSSELS